MQLRNCWRGQYEYMQSTLEKENIGNTTHRTVYCTVCTLCTVKHTNVPVYIFVTKNGSLSMHWSNTGESTVRCFAHSKFVFAVLLRRVAVTAALVPIAQVARNCHNRDSAPNLFIYPGGVGYCNRENSARVGLTKL